MYRKTRALAKLRNIQASKKFRIKKKAQEATFSTKKMKRG